VTLGSQVNGFLVYEGLHLQSIQPFGDFHAYSRPNPNTKSDSHGNTHTNSNCYADRNANSYAYAVAYWAGSNVTPVPGSTFTSSNVTFIWSAGRRDRLFPFRRQFAK